MNRVRQSALGMLLGALLIASWTGTAAAKPSAPPPVPPAKQVVTAATATLEPGTARPSGRTLAAYSPYCEYYGVTPTLGTVSGVQAWFLPNDILYRGYVCQIGKASLRMQTDGNLVVYDENNVARWATHKYAGQRAEFQGFDGNFVVYNNTSSYSGALWASNTCCRTGARLAVQADGNVVVYDSAWRALWATNTWH